VALVSFSPARLPATLGESIPVNIVTDTDKSQMTRGQTNAPKEAKNPFADKVGEQKTVDNPNAKIAPKEVTASTDVAQPPSPPEPKQAAAKSKPEPKRDLIAEALKKDAAAKKAEQKKTADAKVPTPPKRPPQPPQPHSQPKFDPREMQALLDKRDAQRKEATNNVLSDSSTLGIARPKSTAAQLSQNELDALRARLAQLWNPPVGAQNPDEIVVTIRIRLNPDGTLARPPEVTSSGRSNLYMVSRERAAIAVIRGAPFNMLRPETYELWKDIEVTFDPREMVRG
jgi:colicin import membrane protein